MILAETARQSAIYLAHRYYKVPLDRKFTMQSMTVDAHLDRLTIGSAVGEVVLDAQVTEFDRRRGQLTGFAVDLVYHLGNALAGTARATASVLTRDEYEIARWPGDRDRSMGPIPQPDAVARSEVCAPDDGAVTLGRHAAGSGDGRWRLRVDLSHPVLFDHPCDHVPGALVLEAARQASRLRLGWPCAEVESITMRFRQFLELDEPTTVTAVPSHDLGCVAVSFDQWGVEKASGSVRLSITPASTDQPCVGTQRACR
ncbi:A-factor biosynthesis hotdog domain-containing protein [Rhodococcus tukisamuensis]|uniref:A-factor biosynthesis hotdog domain-containing protein n=2 Tax=Rhodococcus tukisamuensis TaxID=168276 RepID=A0A1G6T769_9NOCA|nr:A-factor biosynthesis hotdog domain-containing protein [Rhodococcus tukisamuensis]